MGNALQKLYEPSSALAEVLEHTGTKYSKGVTRADATRAIWAYVKENDLQNPKDRRQIIGDKLLAPIVGKGLSMFQLSRALSKHLK